MVKDNDRAITAKYCARFGQVAVELGFITEAQLKQALCQQVDDNLQGRDHRLIGTILFESDWMTSEQIETVLNTVMKRLREEDGDAA